MLTAFVLSRTSFFGGIGPFGPFPKAKQGVPGFDLIPSKHGRQLSARFLSRGFQVRTSGQRFRCRGPLPFAEHLTRMCQHVAPIIRGKERQRER